ncbi:CLUMA_CG006665, isoform A [Clunio marinus]|uniref:CLUMA_CG006665, isoform A n=1 Tax=Clunio marinus TaxID=568069 RepID=A0A1J1HYA3_9DIPT|nr:CLUMA_CG006665, isoform A [Clunio marinus]
MCFNFSINSVSKSAIFFLASNFQHAKKCINLSYFIHSPAPKDRKKLLTLKVKISKHYPFQDPILYKKKTLGGKQ